MTQESFQDPIERWTAKRRATLVLSILKGETSVAEAARRHGLRVAEIRLIPLQASAQGSEKLLAHGPLEA